MKVLLVAVATLGAIAAAGFPMPDAIAAPHVGELARRSVADPSWQEAGSLVLLATGMFGAAAGLKRRTPPIVTRRPD